ncbi:MAG: hypothetical protein AAF655_27280, partial [Bacteroidota bacterium]
AEDINISAAFSTFIDLKIVGNANVDWVISTITEYETGFNPGANMVTFQVSSSNNFSVAMSMTPMSDGNGNEVDLRNIAVRLFVPEARAAEEGVRWDFAPGDYYVKSTANGWRKSAIWTPTSSDKTILLPGSQGNAGGYVENEFQLGLGLGAKATFDNLPITNLLEQNITPGTYTGTMTLTAIPEAL